MLKIDWKEIYRWIPEANHRPGANDVGGRRRPPNWHDDRNRHYSEANPNYPNVFTSAIRSLAHALRARLFDAQEALNSFSNRPRQTRSGAGQSHNWGFAPPPSNQDSYLSQADIRNANKHLNVSGRLEQENISAAESSVNPAPEQTPEPSRVAREALGLGTPFQIQSSPSTETLPRLNADVAIRGGINSSEMSELGGHGSSWSVSDSSVGNDQGSREPSSLGNPVVSSRDSSTASIPLVGWRAVRGSGPESKASSAAGSAPSSPPPHHPGTPNARPSHQTEPQVLNLWPSPFSSVRGTPSFGDFRIGSESQASSAPSSPPSSLPAEFDRLSPDSPPGLSRLDGRRFGSPAVGVDNLDNRSEAESVGACGLPAALIKIINDLFHSLRL